MKQIPLTNAPGKFALVDDEDFHFVARKTWWSEKGYPTTNISGMRVRLHAFVLPPAPQGFQVDHIDGRPENNCKSNLRFAMPMENSRNKGKGTKPCTSKFKGVHWRKDKKKWAACIRFNYKLIHLGLFKTQEEAAARYNEEAKKLFGQFARPNEILMDDPKPWRDSPMKGAQ